MPSFRAASSRVRVELMASMMTSYSLSRTADLVKRKRLFRGGLGRRYVGTAGILGEGFGASIVGIHVDVFLVSHAAFPLVGMFLCERQGSM